MIKNEEFIEITMKTLKGLEWGERVIVSSFKKDRHIMVTKKEEGYDVVQDGFEKRSYENVDEQSLINLLGVLQRKEFPRSFKLWFSIEKNKHEQLSLIDYY
ncbi:hypothetical protein PBV87_10325 [Niameybacter massiliensis]|uniref:Uncharacterized protein n=1 Tax=Holtiella tumoricola TaxID=3018743 RepID=A0AA42DMS0_9FIRM|nr:hypothetical protein [Holtiella tumoricola]MDA3731874.1 hypothetical protein [Holtiella tumoricola]